MCGRYQSLVNDADTISPTLMTVDKNHTECHTVQASLHQSQQSVIAAKYAILSAFKRYHQSLRLGLHPLNCWRAFHCLNTNHFVLSPVNKNGTMSSRKGGCHLNFRLPEPGIQSTSLSSQMTRVRVAPPKKRRATITSGLCILISLLNICISPKLFHLMQFTGHFLSIAVE